MLEYFSTTTGKYPLHISEDYPKTPLPKHLYLTFSGNNVNCNGVSCNGCSCSNCQLREFCKSTGLESLKILKKLDPKFCETNPEFFI